MEQENNINLAKMISDSGLRKSDICKMLNISKPTLTQWAKTPPLRMRKFMELISLLQKSTSNNENRTKELPNGCCPES